MARATAGTASALDRDDVADASLAGLRAAAEKVDRPAGLGRLEISVTPRGRLTPERASEFAELGVDRLVVLASAAHGAAETIEAAVAATAHL